MASTLAAKSGHTHRSGPVLSQIVLLATTGRFRALMDQLTCPTTQADDRARRAPGWRPTSTLALSHSRRKAGLVSYGSDCATSPNVEFRGNFDAFLS